MSEDTSDLRFPGHGSLRVSKDWEQQMQVLPLRHLRVHVYSWFSVEFSSENGWNPLIVSG